jgi:hypothetical protein
MDRGMDLITVERRADYCPSDDVERPMSEILF